MKENYTQLYPNEQVAIAVSDYAFEHSTKLPKHISDYHNWGVANSERPNYMISPLQAQFQVWFAKALGAKRSMPTGCYYTIDIALFIETNIFKDLAVKQRAKDFQVLGFCSCKCCRRRKRKALWFSGHASQWSVVCSLPSLPSPEKLADDFKVLEIGTYIGFSSLGWASAVGPEGHVTALEFSPEYAAIAEETFAKNGISHAEVVVGDARES